MSASHGFMYEQITKVIRERLAMMENLGSDPRASETVWYIAKQDELRTLLKQLERMKDGGRLEIPLDEKGHRLPIGVSHTRCNCLESVRRHYCPVHGPGCSS